MKSKLKARVLSATLALSILCTACGNTGEFENTEVGSVENGTEVDTDIEAEIEEEVTIEKEDADILFSPEEDEEVETETEIEIEVEEEVTEPELTEEEKAWQNLMIADIKQSLNVRVEAKEDAEVVGKLFKGDVATVLEIGEEWTKVQSGKVVGYVKSSFCLYGLDALAYAKENCKTIAIATVGGLRVRKTMDTDAKVITSLDKGAKLVVDTKAETEEGWIAVKYNGKTYYVSAEYVKVELEVGTADTIAEIKEQQRKEEEAKKKAEEEKKKAEEEKKKAEAAKKDKFKYNKTTKAELAKLDEVTLLAAIIYCEAGGNSYKCQLAVGSVIMNRLKSSKYPDTLAGVLAQKGQFPPATNGKLMNRLNNGKVTASCYKAARAVLAGENNAKGLYFFNDYKGQKGMRIDDMVFW